jgi:acetyl-CoA carboxylase carboxyltransferase component
MSAIIILTPVIIASWPAITAAVAGAATAVGLMVRNTQKTAENLNSQVEQQVEMEIANSEVLTKDLALEKEIVLVKGDIEIRVSRDVRGRCKVCAKGKGHSEQELKEIAEQFVQKMTQCFIYNRVASELKNKGFQMVNEEVMKDETIRLHVRKWED